MAYCPPVPKMPSIRTVLLSAAGCIALTASLGQGGASAQTPTQQELDSLRQAVQEQAQELRAQSQRLNQQLQLLDAQQRRIQQLESQVSPGRRAAPQRAAASAQPPAQAPLTQAPAQAQAQMQVHPPAASAPASSDEAQASQQGAPIQAPPETEIDRQKNQLALQTAPNLAATGGVLTPRGVLVVQPTVQYDYYSQNQAVVSGFTLVPGITFGNVNINRRSQDVYTMGLRIRLGITDRLETNVYVPYVFTNSNTTTSPQSTSATPFSVGASGTDLGDVQFGASYQINAGTGGWPVFVANLQFKTITGTSPFDVPIYTINDPNGTYLQGLQKRLPTGTGFYTLTPSVTVLYPTDPGVLFANVKGIYNFSRRVTVQSTSGGAGTPTTLQPGSGLGISFGMGFSLNDQTSLSLGYEQDFYFAATQDGHNVAGSSYRQGAFNFGLGYQLSPVDALNLGASIGVGANSPAATLVLQYSRRITLF